MDVLSYQRPDLTGYENVLRKIDLEYGLGANRDKAIYNHNMKHDSRSLIGDIVEVREDGRGMCGLEPESFALIKVSMDMETAKSYAGAMIEMGDESSIDAKTPEVLHYKHKCKINMVGIKLNKKKEANLSLAQFNARLTVKEKVEK